MNTESLVREYLRNKSTYVGYVEENIIRLKKDICSGNDDFKLEISDFAFPDTHQVSIDSTNNITDKTAEALMRYEEYRQKMLNERLEQLLYLIDLKKLYDHIDFMIIKLEPKQKVSVDIFSDGGKVSQIADELNCSYNTARMILNNSIKIIAGGVDKDIVGIAKLSELIVH